MKLKILICAGHTLRGKGTGAVGYINEGNENRILAKKVVEWLKVANTMSGIEVEVDYYEINESDTYLQKQVAVANKKDYDIVVQIHFNAYKTVATAMGTEILYDKGSVKGKAYAERVNDKLNDIFKNRGVKERNDLYWLNNTKAPAILIETCFVDSKADTDIYNKDKDKVAKAIAEGIIAKSIVKTPTSNTSSNTYYRVVTNSYLDRTLADKEVSELKKLGINAFLDAFRKDGKTYLRVVAGSYTNRKNADTQIASLKKKGYDPFIAIYKK